MKYAFIVVTVPGFDDQGISNTIDSVEFDKLDDLAKFELVKSKLVECTQGVLNMLTTKREVWKEPKL